MSGFRRRLALLIDGSLGKPLEPPPFDRHELGWYAMHGVERQLDYIAKYLASIDRKTQRRRMRVIECHHPELHPEYPELHVAS